LNFFSRPWTTSPQRGRCDIKYIGSLKKIADRAFVKGPGVEPSRLPGMSATVMFPLFAARFWGHDEARDSANAEENAETNEMRAPPSPARPAKISGNNLRVLDLRSLPADDGGPPTELRARKEKLSYFERDCTHVGDRLYVGAEAIAKDREALRASGITHVVNCVGFLYPPYFEDELKYQVLYLQGEIYAVDVMAGHRRSRGAGGHGTGGASLFS
jgi:hypothetical protein